MNLGMNISLSGFTLNPLYVFVKNTLQRFSKLQPNSTAEKVLYGPELWVGGSFTGVADGTNVTTLQNWTSYIVGSTTANVVGGVLTVVSDGINRGAKYNLSGLKVGSTYILSVDVGVSYASIYFDAANAQFMTAVGTNQVFKFVAGGTTEGVFFRANGNIAAGTSTFDNISVKEILQVPSSVELVTNSGPFTDTTGFTFNTGTSGSVSGGVLNATFTNAYATWGVNLTTVVGKTYRFAPHYSGATGSPLIYVGTSVGGNQIINGVALSSSGATFTATTTSTWVALANSSAGSTIAISKYSVREMVNATVLGPELVSNGGFDNGATGWSAVAAGSVAASNGGLQVSGNGTSTWSGVAEASIPTLSPNKRYLCKFDIISENTSFGAGIYFVTDTAQSSGGVFSNGLDYFYPSTTGSFYSIFTSGSATNVSRLRLVSGNEVSASALFDNISLRELSATESHMYQAGEHVPVLGPELCSIGNFDSASGWSAGAWVIGYGVVTATATSSSLIQSGAVLVAGRSYVVEFDWTHTSGTLYVRVGAGTALTVTASGRQRLTLSTATAAGVEFYGGTVSGALDNISVREILSYTSTLNGFTSGNYANSSGSSVGVIDQPVGLVLDAAGSVGDELAPALESANWAVSGTDATHLITWGTGSFRYQSDTTTPSLSVSKSGLLTVGKTYRIEISVSSYVSGSLKSDSSSAISIGSIGKFSYNVQASITAFNLYRNSTNVDLTISNISVREITGLHASNATTAQQPKLRRGIVNLLTQSDFRDGLTDAPTRGGNISLSSIDGKNAVAFGYDGATTSYAYKTLAHTNGLSYTFSCVVKMDDGLAPNISQATDATALKIIVCGTASGVTVTEVALGDGKYLVAGSVVSIGSTQHQGIVKYAANNNRTFKVTSYSLFQGTLTAQQILAHGGIPLTTTAAASSALGPRYWENVAASNHRLILSAAPFQMADDHCVVVCARNNTSGNFTLFEVGDGSTSNRVCSMRINGGNFNTYWINSEISQNVFAGSTSVGEIVVLTAIKRGNKFFCRKNGVEGGSFTSSTVAGTSTTAMIGARTTGLEIFDGAIYDVIPIKGTLTDAEIAQLEKQAAASAGGRLVNGAFVSNFQ